MNKTLFYLFFFSFSILYSQQAPDIVWSKSYGGSNFEEAFEVKQTPDGGFIVVGNTKSNDGDVSGFHGDQDFWVVKINAEGGIQWEKAFGGSDWEYAYSVDLTVDGGYVVAGTTYSTDGDVTLNPHGDGDFWLIKLNSVGELQWEKSYGWLHNDEAYSVKQTIDNGFVLVGYSEMGDNSSLIIKTDESGNVQWQSPYEGGVFYSVIQIEDGSYIVGGSAGTDDGIFFLVGKYSSDGEVVWFKVLENSQGFAESIIQTADGGYVVVGESDSNNVVKLDQEGNVQWEKFIVGPQSNYAKFYSVDLTLDGGYVIAGVDYSNNSNLFIAKLNDLGELQWQKSMGGWDMDWANSVQQTSDGGYITAGITYSNDGDVNGNHGVSDFWVVKLGPDQLSTDEITQPTISIYPNPVKEFLNFSEKLQNIEIHSIHGKRLMQKGSGLNIDVSVLPSGAYILKAQNQKGEIIKAKFIKY